MRTILTVVSGAAITVATTAQAPTGFDAAFAEFSKTFESSPNAVGIVGRSALVAREGAVLGELHAGSADIDADRRVDRETIWHWASNTKTMTGIAIMQLRERGKLELSDPIVDHVPELRVVHNPFGAMRDITIEHLLSHSAGFRAPTWPWGGTEKWHPHEPTEWSQLVAMLPYTEVEFEPGSRFSYSNPGVVFLGQVIERISGDDWEVYIDKNILKPLDMHRSYFDTTPYHLLEHRSNNYTVRDGKPVANGLDFDTGITVSNGGLNSPLTDMLRYTSFLAGSADPERQAGYDRILPRERLQEMWRPRVASMGLTFFCYADGVVGHTGGQKSFVTFMRIDPATHVVCLGACNTLGPRGSPPATGAFSAQLQRVAHDTLMPVFRDR